MYRHSFGGGDSCARRVLRTAGTFLNPNPTPTSRDFGCNTRNHRECLYRRCCCASSVGARQGTSFSKMRSTRNNCPSTLYWRKPLVLKKWGFQSSRVGQSTLLTKPPRHGSRVQKVSHLQCPYACRSLSLVSSSPRLSLLFSLPGVPLPATPPSLAAVVALVQQHTAHWLPEVVR